MKRILFISEYFYPRKAGGEIWSFDFCKELAKRNNITVITSKYESSLKNEEIIDNIRILRPLQNYNLNNIIGRIYFSIKLRKIIINFVSNNKIDEIHSLAFGANVVTSSVAKKHKINSITWVHAYFGKYWFKMENPFKSIFMIFLEKLNLFLDKSNQINVPSLSTSKLINKRNINIVPNKVNSKELINIVRNNKNNILKIYNIPKNKKILLTVGSLNKVKRIHKIVSEIIIPDSHFYVIVGSGEFKNKIMKTIIKKNLTKKVLLIENMERNNLLKLISISEYVLNYSLIESFGLVLAEALALNTKLITTKVGFLEDFKFDKKEIRIVRNINELNDVLNN